MPTSHLSVFCKLVALGALVLPLALTASNLQWNTIHAQTVAALGSSSRPSIRYGHAVDMHNGEMLTTHGYFYNRDNNVASWMSDTWAMKATSNHKWRQLSAGITQAAALAAYSKNNTPIAPCGRFGHATAISGNKLYMYGGHDGGQSRHGAQNYEPGYDFEELWEMDLKSKTWRILPFTTVNSPGKRYLFDMVAVDGNLLLYGGMVESQGDVWSYNIEQGTWTQLQLDMSRNLGGPGRRVGHAMIPVNLPNGARGFLLYGGRWIEEHATQLEPDLWFFDLHTAEWRRLDSVNERPPARKYHAFYEVSFPLAGGKQAYMPLGIIGGGTITTPALTCAGDAWAMAVDCELKNVVWERLPDLPTAVYDLRGGGEGNNAFMFGGHLCTSTKGELPFFYINSVAKLELQHNYKPVFGCRVAGHTAVTFGADDIEEL